MQHFGEPPEDPTYVFAGTRANLRGLGEPAERLDYCFAKFDFPFSFVLDFILLPAAIPLALTSSPKPPPDEPESAPPPSGEPPAR